MKNTIIDINQFNPDFKTTKKNDAISSKINDILNWNNYLKEIFLSHFPDFVPTNPLSLIPEDHKSILFTNSAIVSLLEKMRKWEEIWKHSILQPCLRTQNLQDDIDIYPNYMSWFTMIWVYTNYSKFHYENMCDQIQKFAINTFWEWNFAIAIDKSQTAHIEYWDSQQVELMDHPNNYYNWNFWNVEINWKKDHLMNTVSGKWISLMINWQNCRKFEIWNMLIIYIGQKPEYIMFWIWLETTKSIKSKWEKHQVDFLPYADLIKNEIGGYNVQNPIHIRLIDTLNIIKIIDENSILPWTWGRKAIARKAMLRYIEIVKELWFSADKSIKLLHNTWVSQDTILHFIKRFTQ